MIVDTDTHNFCVEIFKDFKDPEVYRTLKNLLIPEANLNKKWKQFYNHVKATKWPEAGNINEFHLLPEHVRRELKAHQQGLIRISDDLQSVYVDDKQPCYPSIAEQMTNGSVFCKTTHQVINIETTSILFDYHRNTTTAVELMQHYNKKMCELCEENPNIDFNLWLTMNDIDACLAELNKYKDRKFFGVLIEDRLPWALIPAAFPIFDFCNEHKIPVYFHVLVSKLPIEGITWDFDHETYKALVQEHPYTHMAPPKYKEWKTNIALLVTEKSFERWPDLRIILAEKHHNWMAPLQEFMLSNGWPDPMPYFKKHFWLTIEPEEAEFFAKAEMFGYDKLMFATDYPHNDQGGAHRYADVDLVNSYLADKLITQTQYDQLMFKNYLFLKNRA